MTFVVNQDGEIYKKDLKPTTATIAKQLTRSRSNTTRQSVDAPPQIAGVADEDNGGG